MLMLYWWKLGEKRARQYNLVQKKTMPSGGPDFLMGWDQFQITRSSLLSPKQTENIEQRGVRDLQNLDSAGIPSVSHHARPGMRKSCKVACRGDKINTLSAPEIFSLGGARRQFIITFCEDNRWPASHGHRASGRPRRESHTLALGASSVHDALRVQISHARSDFIMHAPKKQRPKEAN
jgi:hypothetical protein